MFKRSLVTCIDNLNVRTDSNPNGTTKNSISGIVKRFAGTEKRGIIPKELIIKGKVARVAATVVFTHVMILSLIVMIFNG